MTTRSADDEERVEAGEVYYLEPGHNLTIEPGTILLMISPVEEFQETLDAVARAQNG